MRLRVAALPRLRCSTLTAGFLCMAGPLVNGCQVLVAVVVTSDDVVDLIGAGFAADVADASVPAKYATPDLLPVLR